MLWHGIKRAVLFAIVVIVDVGAETDVAHRQRTRITGHEQWPVCELTAVQHDFTANRDFKQETRSLLCINCIRDLQLFQYIPVATTAQYHPIGTTSNHCKEINFQINYPNSFNSRLIKFLRIS